MAFFKLCSDITIGNFRFAGVHEVRIKRSMQSVEDSATITLPSIAKIVQGQSQVPVEVITGNLFNDGEPVTINLGYNDNSAWTPGATPIIPGGKNDGLCTMFQGFVKRRGLGMPLVVECEGYCRKLRQDIDVTHSYDATTASELLNLLKTDSDGNSTGINVIVKDDLDLLRVKLRNVNGLEIIDSIKRFSEGVLNVFFINPTTLWCGLTYTPYSRGEDPFNLGVVDYDLGYNCIKDNSLEERVNTDERIQILFGGTTAVNNKVFSASDDKAAKRKYKSHLSNVGDVAELQKLANEKQYKTNYEGYTGSINTFLQPYCAPGWIANIHDRRYPERDGQYMIEGTEVTFGQRGARIRVQIGPLLNFKPTPVS